VKIKRVNPKQMKIKINIIKLIGKDKSK